MSEWISVKDKLPEQSTDVLCIEKCVGCIDITIGHYYQWSEAEKPYWIDHHSYTLENVTHWMPFPKLPIEYQNLRCS